MLQRSTQQKLMKVFAGFMIFATILFLVGPMFQ